MDLVKLTEYLVQALVQNPDSVSVKEITKDDEINIEVIVSKDDIGTVIGKNGSNANAIRTLVQAAAYTNNLPRVRINIDAI